MIREIVKNDFDILTKQSATIKDESLAKRIEKDLYDTANNYADRCIGLSAVQIGEHYKIAVVATNLENYKPFTMCNPIILKKFNGYDVEEGCMSLDGRKVVKRWNKIEVLYSTPNSLNKSIKRVFTGFMAEIVQHEIDHFNGILI